MTSILKHLLLIFSLLFVGVITTDYSAQEEPVNEHFEKKKKERKKDAENAEAEILKHHEEIQSKQTQKMMKKTKKKSKRLKKGKHAQPFYKRWFTKH